MKAICEEIAQKAKEKQRNRDNEWLRDMEDSICLRGVPAHHSHDDCFLEGIVMWNLFASAFGAPRREYFKIIHLSFL